MEVDKTKIEQSGTVGWLAWRSVYLAKQAKLTRVKLTRVKLTLVTLAQFTLSTRSNQSICVNSTFFTG